MGGGNKINIVTALALQTQHHCGQLTRICFNSLPQVTDLVILAEYAEKIAMGKKDCSGPSAANQGAFLAKMRGVT